MNLQYRITLLGRLGTYILSNDPAWTEAKHLAGIKNGWFTPDFVAKASSQIAHQFLQPEALTAWAEAYNIPAERANPRKVGIVMAGNIPLVGFHDWLCVFLSGHQAVVKASTRDEVLIKHLVEVLISWEPSIKETTSFAEMLKGCDAYIATGSNNTSGYFAYYFSKYPHIIRKNRTSAAILTGDESAAELEKLADDSFLYFGLGCRNVTKIYVPRNYDFLRLLTAMKKYDSFADHHKYKNNYDYNLAIHLLNNVAYMSTPALLLAENDALFSPISQLNYSYYDNLEVIQQELSQHPDLQCLVSSATLPFGSAQAPKLTDYADGVDTMAFLQSL